MEVAAPRHPIRLEEHLALYGVFHRDWVNRAIHALTVPVILLTGMMLLAPVGLGSGPLRLDAGLVIVLAAVVAEARLDAVFALATAAWSLPLVWLSQRISGSVSLVALLSLNAIVQLAAWYLTVKIGHEKFEARLAAPGGEGTTVSSNTYFDRGYFVLRNVGREASLLESLQQFAIGPFVVTLDLLFASGFRPHLRARVEVLREAYIARIARGEPVMALHVPQVAPATRVPLAVSLGSTSRG